MSSLHKSTVLEEATITVLFVVCFRKLETWISRNLHFVCYLDLNPRPSYYEIHFIDRMFPTLSFLTQ